MSRRQSCRSRPWDGWWTASIFRVDKGHQAPNGERFLARGCLRVLIFLTGGGTILSREAEPVAFKAGDCFIIPAAFEGAARFTQDTEYLTVTM